MKPIGACIFVVYFLMIFASLVRFYVFVMPLGGSKLLAVDVSIRPYQWLGRSPSYHEVLTPVQLLLRLQNHHHHTQVAATSQTSLAMDREAKKQVQSIIDQLKGHSLPDGGEIVGSINSSSSEFNATNNRAHIVRQYESGSSAADRKTTRETPDRKGITFSLFSLEDLLQYFVRKLINAVSEGILLAIHLLCSKVSRLVSVCILLAIYLLCSKVSQLVRSSTQPSASQQVEIVERIPLSLSDFAATIDNSPYKPIVYTYFPTYEKTRKPKEPEKPKEPKKPKVPPLCYIPPAPYYLPYEKIRIAPVPAPVPTYSPYIPSVPAPPPKAPEKPKEPEKPKVPKKRKLAKGKGRVTLENLQQYFGHNRKDVAASLGVSVSTFKRICRLQGIKRWRNRMGSSGSVSKPLDQDGERNTSTACETPSHNVQTGTEGELFGQNEVANVLRRDFMGGPNALDTESGLIMVSRPPDQHGERNTSTACETPSHNVENEMGCQNSKPNEFQPHSFEDLNFWNTEIGSIAEILSDCDFLALEEEPSLEGLVSGSVNLTVAACSDPAPCQHPMPTMPDTMTTTHMMPHLAAKGDVRFVTLKVTYGKKIIKFQFPLMSGIIELKEEVKKRLKLELDSFDIEYKDEDGDCIFLGCDEDLRNHLQLFSNQVIRLLVVDSDPIPQIFVEAVDH